MTSDNQRAMINRIVYNLIDTLSDGEKVTKKFKKLYDGGQGAKNVDKKIKDVEAIGLPNIVDNVMKNGKIKDEFLTSEYKYTEMEINGVKETVRSEEPVTEPNTDKMAETTNRATALTYAYALFTELNKIQDELDDKTQKISNLESKVSNLENEIKSLKSTIQTIKTKIGLV